MSVPVGKVCIVAADRFGSGKRRLNKITKVLGDQSKKWFTVLMANFGRSRSDCCQEMLSETVDLSMGRRFERPVRPIKKEAVV